MEISLWQLCYNPTACCENMCYFIIETSLTPYYFSMRPGIHSPCKCNDVGALFLFNIKIYISLCTTTNYLRQLFFVTKESLFCLLWSVLLGANGKPDCLTTGGKTMYSLWKTIGLVDEILFFCGSRLDVNGNGIY